MTTKGSRKKKSKTSPKEEQAVARDITELPEFIRWLNQQQGTDKPPMYFSIHWLDFSREWELTFTSNTESRIACVNEDTRRIVSLPLQNALCTPNGLKLMVYDLSVILEHLFALLGTDIDVETFVRNVQDETVAKEYSCGGVLDVDCPAFYKAVALPSAKLHALQYAPPLEGTPVTVSYTNLLLRLLTYFSNDPTLTRIFSAEDNPDAIGILKEKLELPREKVLEALTVTAFGGYTEDTVQKTLPVYHWWATEELPGLISTDYPRTIYGRMGAVAQAREDAKLKTLHHLIFGSVFDLVDVAAVSLANVGVKRVTVGEGWPIAEKAVVRGIVPLNEETAGMEQDIRQIVNLANPLGDVPLGATVIIG